MAIRIHRNSIIDGVKVGLIGFGTMDARTLSALYELEVGHLRRMDHPDEIKPQDLIL